VRKWIKNAWKYAFKSAIVYGSQNMITIHNFSQKPAWLSKSKIRNAYDV